MRDFTLQNVGEPTNDKDVATKEYVDNSGEVRSKREMEDITLKVFCISEDTRLEVLKIQKRVVRLPTRDT